MNEQSPEAKQAAEEGYSVEYIAAKRIADELAFRPPMPTQFDISAAVKIIRTATAKLKEELIATQNEVIRLNGLLRVSNTERRDAQLAHQQPSAGAAGAGDCTCDIDTVCQVHGGRSTTTIRESIANANDYATLEESATTPELEKIARETASEIKDFMSDTHKELIIERALAQARAPLVELEQQWREHWRKNKGPEMCWQTLIQCANEFRAALTGTGEKSS